MRVTAPRRTAFVAAGVIGLMLSSCSTNSAPKVQRSSRSPVAGSSAASHTATSLSIRQIYETDSGITGADITDTGPVSGNSTNVPASGPAGESAPPAAEPATPETTPSAAEEAAYAKLDCSISWPIRKPEAIRTTPRGS